MNKLFLVEVMKNHKMKKEIKKEEINIELIKTEAVGDVVYISDYFMNKKCN